MSKGRKMGRECVRITKNALDASQWEAPFRPGHVYNSRIALRPHVAKQLPSSPAGRRYPLSWQTGYKIQPQIPENCRVSVSKRRLKLYSFLKALEKYPLNGEIFYYDIETEIMMSGPAFSRSRLRLRSEISLFSCLTSRLRP